MATITPPPDASDEDLAVNCDLAGLYERYAHRMLAYTSSRGVPAHDLDDVVQDIWIRVHNGLKAKPFVGHFSGWLFQIARSVVIDRFRKPVLTEGMPEDERVLEMNETPQVILTRREIHDQLERCLEHLSDRERDLVRARTAGEGYDEVCELLRIDRNTAYKTYHKATAKLADCMNRAGYDAGSSNDS